MDDYKKNDGLIDWDSYHKAQINAGEICKTCQTHIMLGAQGTPRQCQSCTDIKENLYETVEHHHYARCPKCEKIFDVYKNSDYKIYNPHPVVCPGCGHNFDIEVHISFEFGSPPVTKEEPDDQSTQTPAAKDSPKR